MASVKWSSPSWTNSGIGTSAIASGAASAVGSAITNGTDLNLYMDVSIRLSSFTPGTAPWFEVHLLPLSGDASTYVDRTASTRVAILAVSTGASAKTLMAIGILLPPGSVKLQLVNKSEASATPAADIQYRTYSYQ